MRYLSSLGDFVVGKLVPPLDAASRVLLHGVEQLFNSMVVLLLCVLCFCFGVYSELHEHKPPATLVQFCEQALNPDLTASKRALYIRKLLRDEK